MRKVEVLLILSSLVMLSLSACATEAPATAAVMPEFVMTATEQVNGGEQTPLPTPTQETSLTEEGDLVATIQTDCQEYLAATQDDVCMGFVEDAGRHTWTGVLSEQYEPGTTISVYAVRNDNSVVLLAGGTSGSEREFTISQEGSWDPFITTVIAEIGGNNNLAYLRGALSERDYDAPVWSFSVPDVTPVPTPPLGDGNPNT